jgi:hypothetical protein
MSNSKYRNATPQLEAEIDPKQLTATEKGERLNLAARLNEAIDHCERRANAEGGGITNWIKETLWRASGLILKLGRWALIGIQKFITWVKQMWNSAKLTTRIVEAWRAFMNPPIAATVA